jgi:hypothetical protein
MVVLYYIYDGTAAGVPKIINWHGQDIECKDGTYYDSEGSVQFK